MPGRGAVQSGGFRPETEFNRRFRFHNPLGGTQSIERFNSIGMKPLVRTLTESQPFCRREPVWVESQAIMKFEDRG